MTTEHIKKEINWLNEKRRLSQLIEWDKNPRQLSEYDAEHIRKSLDKFGLADPLIINADNLLIGGHQRKRILQMMGERYGDVEIDVRVPDRLLAGEEVAELNIRLNKNAGTWDWDVLANEFDAIDLIDWGFTEEELMGLDFGEEPPDDPGAQIDRAEELREKWGVELGQLWKLGEHRLICGDCTDRAVVERMMGGERARLVWTDPPYGVNYGAKLDVSNPIAHRVRNIENDDLNPEQLEAFIRSAFVNCAEFTVDGAAIYAACPPGTLLPRLIAAFRDSGFTFHWGLVWVKDQLVLGRGDYHFIHENILYGWKHDAAHYFVNDRTQVSVFEYPRPKSSEEHPTMKPVDLVCHMITNSSQVGEMVVDVFLGSGSTLIACERLNRKCRAVEISPAYCAVAIERWHEMTGQDPELIDSVAIQSEDGWARK